MGKRCLRSPSARVCVLVVPFRRFGRRLRDLAIHKDRLREPWKFSVISHVIPHALGLTHRIFSCIAWSKSPRINPGLANARYTRRRKSLRYQT
jgi:hypothetical protein